MTRENRFRVFAPELLEAMAARGSRWRTELEAASAGPHRVVRRGGAWSVLDDPEPDDGASVADFKEERWALLFAATRGARCRDRVLHLGNAADASGRFPVLERSLYGDKVEVAGWHSRSEERDLEAMHVAEYVLRSPRRLAHFLEASGREVLAGAAEILARRLGLCDPRERAAEDASARRVACRYRLEVVAETSLEHPGRPLKSGDEQAAWLAEVLPRSPVEIGGGLYLDPDFWPIGYSQYDGGFATIRLEPRQIFAPALLVNAGYVSVWHTHPDQKDLRPSRTDYRHADLAYRCGDDLSIPVLTAIIFGADRRHVLVPRRA